MDKVISLFDIRRVLSCASLVSVDMGKATQTYTVEGSVDRGESIQVVILTIAAVAFLFRGKQDRLHTDEVVRNREKAS